MTTSFSQPEPDTNDPEFWVSRGQCPIHFQTLPCGRGPHCSYGVPQQTLPKPWEAIGWTETQWVSFAWACAVMDDGSAGPHMTEAFGPNEKSNPRLEIRQAFIKAKQEQAQAIREDGELEQKEYDDRARRRAAADEKVRRERAQRRINGELSPTAQLFREKLEAGLKTAAELDDLPDPEPVVDGWLYADTINWIAGASGTFKSFVAHDLAARYGSSDMTYHGIPMAHGKALYVIAEGAGMFKYRKQAWEHYNRKVEDVTYYPFPIQISDFEEQMPALIALAREGGYGVVIFDTQAMCTVGDDENQAKDMGIIINAVHSLREATKGCVILVHHFDKGGNGMRGSGAQFAAASTVIVTKRDGDKEWVTLSTKKKDGGKAKDDEGRDDIRLKLEKWQPVDANGQPLRGSLCPLRDDAGSQKPPEMVEIPVFDQERTDLLKKIVFFEDLGGMTGTDIRDWMNEYYPRDEGQYKTNGAESRAKRLVTAGCVVKKGSKWLPTELGVLAVQQGRDEDEDQLPIP
ncbi:AAA family ATPase [Streptomyces nigra]|uniref:AAA family ATPase n=1 Tax=Streptomyces nigra TaxID=1827580 RepID=UPI0036AEF90D